MRFRHEWNEETNTYHFYLIDHWGNETMSKYAIFEAGAKGIETIKGNGWDINSGRIELNGINAHLICEDDYRCVSMNGPAVENIFKCLRELIEENRALTEENERCIKENQKLEIYCEELRAYFNKQIDEKTKLYDELEQRYEELKEDNNMEIKKRDGYIDCLKRKLDEKTENYDRLQDLYLKEINKQYALRERVRELEEENNESVYSMGIQDHKFRSLKEMLNDEKMNEKTINYCMNDVMMTQKVYDFSITFCKVPVESKEDE